MWGKKDYESVKRNHDFRVQRGPPFQGLVPQTTSSGDHVMEWNQGQMKHNWARWEPAPDEMPHEVTKFNKVLQQIDDRLGHVEQMEPSFDHRNAEVLVINPQVMQYPCGDYPPTPPPSCLGKLIEVLGSAVCVMLLLILTASVAYALPNQTQPTLRLLHAHAKPWLNLAREVHGQYMGGNAQGEYSGTRPLEEPEPRLPLQVSDGSSINRTAESVQAHGEWRLDGQRGAWVPKEGTEQGGGLAIIPNRESERLIDLEVLAKEGANWRMDNRIRVNSRGDHKEALLTPYKDKEQAHASNLVVLPSGEILCVWLSGLLEGQYGNSIVISRLYKSAPQWTRAELVITDPLKVSQSPVLYFDETTEQLYLLYTSYEDQVVSPIGLRKKAKVVTRAGPTEVRSLSTRYAPGQPFLWSESRSVPYFGANAQIRNQLLRGVNGDEWLLPLHYNPLGTPRPGALTDPGNSWADAQISSLARTFDDTSLWSVNNMSSPGMRLIEPTVVRLRNGKMLGFFRDSQAGFIYRAESENEGRSWDAPVRTALPNNNMGIQAVELASGNLLMVFNNNAGEKSPVDSKMWPMSVALSTDRGVMWQVVRDLEESFDTNMDYIYPSIVQSKDKWIHVSYTWSYGQFSRICIRYASFTEEWLMRHKWKTGYTKGLYLGAQNFEYNESFDHKASKFDGIQDRS